MVSFHHLVRFSLFYLTNLFLYVVVDEKNLISIQNEMDQKVDRVWTDLSTFKKSATDCIPDMLLNVASGAYLESIRIANQFVIHLEVLFFALDSLDDLLEQKLDCSTEAHLVCEQMIRFFQLLTIPSKSDVGTTQELTSLVTGIAHNLNSLIRIGLAAALHLVRIRFLIIVYYHSRNFLIKKNTRTHTNTNTTLTHSFLLTNNYLSFVNLFFKHILHLISTTATTLSLFLLSSFYFSIYQLKRNEILEYKMQYLNF